MSGSTANTIHEMRACDVCAVMEKIIISPVADCLDRFDEGPDAGIGDRMLPLLNG